MFSFIQNKFRMRQQAWKWSVYQCDCFWVISLFFLMKKLILLDTLHIVNLPYICHQPKGKGHGLQWWDRRTCEASWCSSHGPRLLSEPLRCGLCWSTVVSFFETQNISTWWISCSITLHPSLLRPSNSKCRHQIWSDKLDYLKKNDEKFGFVVNLLNLMASAARDVVFHWNWF